MATREFDVLVIGEGLAGATASAAAVSEGARVALVSKGPGAFVLADGCVELQPDSTWIKSELLGSEEDCKASIRFFLATAAAAGCEYRGGLGETISVPTILGTFRQVALAPLYFGSCDLHQLRNVVVAGFEGSLDFDARFIVERLASRARACGSDTIYAARSLKLSLKNLQPAHELEFATHFDRNARFREDVIMALAAAAENAELLIVPAVLGLGTSTDELRMISQLVGCPLCEIATLPPSILGIRLLRRFERYLTMLGVEFSTGFSVNELLFEGDQCRGVLLDTPGRLRRIEAQAVVVATGGFSHLLDEDAAVGSDPAGRTAVVNQELFVCAGKGGVIARNLFACGGALRTSNVYSENAIAIVTGFRAGRLAAAVGVHHAGR